MVRQIIASGYSSGLFAFSFDEASGQVQPLLEASKAIEGSESDAFMSYIAYDDRTKNLYAVHEFEGEVGKDFAGEAIISRWELSEKLTSVQKKQVSGIGSGLSDKLKAQLFYLIAGCVCQGQGTSPHRPQQGP